MGFLDLFKPKWRHSNADVRADAVKQLGADDASLLERIIRDDDDARVRRIALKKITNWELLGEVAKSDPDEALRRDAGEKAADLLFDAAVADSDEQRCREALGRIASTRVIAKVARLAPFAGVRRAALERLDDGKPLAEVARQAPDPQIRLAAVERLTDVAALRDVAIGDTHKEVALRAVERLDDDDALAAVDKKCKIKAVRAAAREKLDALRQANPAGAVGPSTEKRRRARQAQLCRTVESAAGSEEWDRAQDEIDAATTEWATLPGAEEAFQRRFDRALERWKSRKEERLKQLRAKSETEAQAKARVDAALAESARRKREEEAEQKTTDEAGAAESAEREAERARMQEERAKRDAEKAAERAKREAEKAEEQQRRDAEAQENLARLEAVTARLESLAATDDRKAGEKALKSAQEVIGASGNLPRDKHAEARARFQAARDKLHIRVQELRDADEWKRWSNVPRLEGLCAKMEALLTVEDLKLASQELRALQAEWKSVGGASKEKSEALWARFKAASDQVYERCKTHFAALDENRAANLKKKEELCARVEGLADSTDWKETAETIKALQEEWKGVGQVPKEQADAIWQRFRGACDKFFERRKAHFAQLDEERAANLKKQEALCVRVEALADSTDWKGAADDIKAAQAEWKEIGPAPKDQADAIWQRFRGACDKFFDRRKAHFAQLDDERAANLKAKEGLCTLAEELAALDGDARAENAEKVKQLQAQWKEIGPAPRDDADAVWDRFRAACDQAMAAKKVRQKAAAPEAAPKPPKPSIGGLGEKLVAAGVVPVENKPAIESKPIESKPIESKPAADVDAGWAAMADEPPTPETKK
ncbi:MAG TPA: DUF349 domain-containing protein [Polyangia bacterium]|nr:DUF349 domain-containing protein [Polyangia bacterium]